MKLVWVTERSAFHQQKARQAAPPQIEVTMLYKPPLAVLHEQLAQAEALISERHGDIDAALFDFAPNLKLIVRLGAMDDDIDQTTAELRGIKVVRQPVIGNLMVAEHCLMMLLALSKRLPSSQQHAITHAGNATATRTDENTFRYNWANMEGIGGIYGKTVGIIGMGDIGFELARRLIPFMPEKLLYTKRQRFAPNIESKWGIAYADLAGICRLSDALVCLLPYAPETDHLINAERIAQMKQGAILVQAGSGSTLDENALAQAIENGHLGGAALDTLEYEPLQPDHPLLKLAQNPSANVILTPHVAAATLPQTFNRSYEYDAVVEFFGL